MMFPFGNTGHKPVCKRNFFRILLTTEEILAKIEEDESITLAMVFIQPPCEGMESEGDSGDEDTGDTVNNLSGKQLQATAEARVTSASQSQEDDEGDKQSGFVLYSRVANSQCPLDAGSCSNPAPGLRKKTEEKMDE